MRYISLLGLLVLLLIAFGLSAHKNRIKYRVVIWGLFLQTLFAMIILSRSYLSFVGMFILILMIILFINRGNLATVSGRVSMPGLLRVLSVIIAGLVIGMIGHFAGITGIFLFILITVIAVGAHFKWDRVQPWTISSFLSVGFFWLYANDYNGRLIFRVLSDKVDRFLRLTDLGSQFLFGNLADRNLFFPGSDFWPGFGFQFAFVVLPTIIFFGSFIAILYHLGVMQATVKAIAKFMQWTLGTSGAETLSCSANIFVGQTEAPLLIKPFLPDMTISELSTIMVGGFATIAGGVLAAYIAMGVNAGHLIAASVMSAPAALLVGKIIYPETEHSLTAGDVEIPDVRTTKNVLDAASQGVTDGLKLAANVGAMLVAFIALIALLDLILNYADRLIDGKLLSGVFIDYSGPRGFSPVSGEYSGIFPGSLKTLFGTVLRPLAWVMGVPWQDAAEVGNLLGIKITLNEMVAYSNLTELIRSGALSERSIIISTYALCGFANFSSIGIQIGGISALVPQRRGDLARVAMKAMIGGALASWITATIAGIVL